MNVYLVKYLIFSDDVDSWTGAQFYILTDTAENAKVKGLAYVYKQYGSSAIVQEAYTQVQQVASKNGDIFGST